MMAQPCQVAPLFTLRISLATLCLRASSMFSFARLFLSFFVCSQRPPLSPLPHTWWLSWWTAGAPARPRWWRRASSSPTTTLPPSRALLSLPFSVGNIRTRVNQSPQTHSTAPSFLAACSGISQKLGEEKSDRSFHPGSLATVWRVSKTQERL